MAEVVDDSTSHMTDADLQAIAVYLKSLPRQIARAAPVSTQDRRCALADHLQEQLRGLPHDRGRRHSAPVLGASGQPVRAIGRPTSLIRVVLQGRRAWQPTAPTGPSMPSFAWKLSDEEVAAVITYIRNGGGTMRPPFRRAMCKARGGCFHRAQTSHDRAPDSRNEPRWLLRRWEQRLSGECPIIGNLVIWAMSDKFERRFHVQ